MRIEEWRPILGRHFSLQPVLVDLDDPAVRAMLFELPADHGVHHHGSAPYADDFSAVFDEAMIRPIADKAVREREHAQEYLSSLAFWPKAVVESASVGFNDPTDKFPVQHFRT